MTIDPFERGLRGMAHAENVRITRTADALAAVLFRLACAVDLPREVLAMLPHVPAYGLPTAEGEALWGRIGARAVERAAGPVVEQLVEVSAAALVAEADRLEPYAAAVDLLLRASRAPTCAPLTERLHAARQGFARLVASDGSPAAIASRHALLQALTEDLELPRAVAALRGGAGADLASHVHTALTSVPGADAERRLQRRARLLLAPLADLLDLHLDEAFVA